MTPAIFLSICVFVVLLKRATFAVAPAFVVLNATHHSILVIVPIFDGSQLEGK